MNMKDVKSIGARLAKGSKAKATPAIDAAAIRELAELLTETGLTEIEIEQGGARLRVAKQAGGHYVSAAAPAAACGNRSSSRSSGHAERSAGRRRALAHGRHRLCRARAGQAALRQSRAR